MSYGFVTAAYISASVLFILSLGGLSNQESAKRAVWFGIIGMAMVPSAIPGLRSGTTLLALPTSKIVLLNFIATSRTWRSHFSTRIVLVINILLVAEQGSGD